MVQWNDGEIDAVELSLTCAPFGIQFNETIVPEWAGERHDLQ